MVLSIMTKAVLAATDRQLAVTHIFLRLDLGVQPRCLLRQAETLNTFFVSVGIWDTTAMLAETDEPFVMTNAMLAKTNGQLFSKNGFWISKSSAC